MSPAYDGFRGLELDDAGAIGAFLDDQFDLHGFLVPDLLGTSHHQTRKIR